MGCGHECDPQTTVAMAIVLVDCNSFYCSCESVFQPRLWTTPLVVLSNNDGSVVSLNESAKALGIRKCQPFFGCRDLMSSANLAVRSSNFALYGDMSARVMETLRQFSPSVEVYSIDEAFLCLRHVEPQARTDYARRIRAIVRQHTGIPISIGVAETKTLAKVANRYAKQTDALEGVLDITGSLERQLELLAALPVVDVWGIGSRWGQMLRDEGIDTALKLREQPDWWVRMRMGVVGLRTVFELRGSNCLPLELYPRRRKSMMVSRTFGRATRSRQELEEAIATFTASSARKLRREQLIAGALCVFVSSSRFKENFYYNSARSRLMTASNHTPTLLKSALALAQQLWRDDVEFARAGVILTQLVDENIVQLSWLDDYDPTDERAQRLMQTLDRLNQQSGQEPLRYAVMGTTGRWQTRGRYRSNRWTTRWSELPIVRC
ncbi:MAG: Protein UmuC [Chroococcidiopsis cubana SAG 39.79]|nr:Y-family DNA polymerase [Chroococcidiopsis cubana]MDZ4878992.1 Protein UmuC [Chroococcidiopsis cubana SAG 39.79]